MTDLTLRGCPPLVLLSHLALYGLGAILESAGTADVRIGWTAGGNPRPVVGAPSSDDATIAELVGAHARAAADDDSWVQRDIDLNGRRSGLMSPRLAAFRDDDTRRKVQGARHETLDSLTAAHRWLDLRFLAALGEPSYWNHNRQNETLQDHGASRLEMQPRNQGSEFVKSRLRKLASVVAARTIGQVTSGLRGDTVHDEVGNNRSASRTATGLANPGPTDNAVAWCALWGIAQFPIAMRVSKNLWFSTPAATSGHVRTSGDEWFYAPIWSGAWHPARLRTIVASRAARTVAEHHARPLGDSVADAELTAAQAWLQSRDVAGLICFPIRRFGSDSAPERRALRGEPTALRGT